MIDFPTLSYTGILQLVNSLASNMSEQKLEKGTPLCIGHFKEYPSAWTPLLFNGYFLHVLLGPQERAIMN